MSDRASLTVWVSRLNLHLSVSFCGLSVCMCHNQWDTHDCFCEVDCLAFGEGILFPHIHISSVDSPVQHHKSMWGSPRLHLDLYGPQMINSDK